MTTAAPKDEKALAKTPKTLPQLLNDPGTIKRFEEMLGRDARSFQQNILTVFQSGTLAGCDPESIIAAAAISASINLSILPSLGHSCLVPYKDGDRVVAQWQLMWKGVIQLAQRSKRYAKINLARVYDGQLVKHDEFKGTVTLDASKRKSDRVMGYYFYFKLNDGYEHEAYWSAKTCIEHGLRFSKSFQKGGGKWAEDPAFEAAGGAKKWLSGKEHFLTEGSGADAMSAKSIVKNVLLKYGPLETRISEVITLDQAVIGPDGRPTYIDTTAEPGTEPKTYTAPPAAGGAGKQEPTPAEKLLWARDAAKKQGVSNETFDTWVRQQPGDETAKADAATVAWKRVATKEITATEAFKVKEEAEFEVYSVAKTDLYGQDALVIKDTSEPAVKYFTNEEPIAEAARIAKADKTKFAIIFEMRGEGKNTYRWIVARA